jgi:diadenosine tetraphosphate (Ap4A) HIT family hydrolase
VNETILRFGYPDTLVAEYRHWLVLLRPQQPTLGSLVLAAAGDFTSFSDLPEEAFAELRGAVSDLEAGGGPPAQQGSLRGAPRSAMARSII